MDPLENLLDYLTWWEKISEAVFIQAIEVDLWL